MRKLSLYFRVIFALASGLTLFWFFPTNQSSAFVTGGFNASTVEAVGVSPATEIDALIGQWIQTSGPPAWQVGALVVKGDYVFAGGRGAWRFSSNGGVWNPVNRGLPASRSSTITSFAITDAGASLLAGTNMDGVFRSTDNGDNWTSSSNGLPQFTGVTDFVVDGSNLFLATGSGVYLSTNDGENWTAVNNGLPSQGYIFALAVGGNNLFASTVTGVYRSCDSGAHWVSAGNGLPIGSAQEALAAVGSNIFAGSFFGVYLSTDAGANWVRSSNGLPQNADVVTLFASGCAIYAGLEEGMIYRSTDNGANWNAVSDGLPKTSINALAAKETSLFAATSSGVFTSNNNAVDWIEMQSGAVESSIVHSPRAGRFS
jgi:ligand-binding sensor domain-containing protein